MRAAEAVCVVCASVRACVWRRARARLGAAGAVHEAVDVGAERVEDLLDDGRVRPRRRQHLPTRARAHTHIHTHAHAHTHQSDGVRAARAPAPCVCVCVCVLCVCVLSAPACPRRGGRPPPGPSAACSRCTPGPAPPLLYNLYIYIYTYYIHTGPCTVPCCVVCVGAVCVFAHPRRRTRGPCRLAGPVMQHRARCVRGARARRSAPCSTQRRAPASKDSGPLPARCKTSKCNTI